MNMAKGFIRIFPKLKRDTVENGVQICRLIAAGVIREKPNGEYKRQRKKK